MISIVVLVSFGYWRIGSEKNAWMPSSRMSRLTTERRFVRVVERRAGKVGLSEGVKEGERVVTSGQTRLQPGGAVSLDDRPALVAPDQRPKP